MDGTLVGAGRSGCGDIYGARSSAHAIEAIDAAVTQALGAAGVTREQLAVSAFSAAGADWPEDFVFLREALAQRRLPDPQIYNDAIGALRAGSPDGSGVVVVCGTGAAVGARHTDGRLWHSSFWQQTGGAGELANRMLRAVCAADMAMGPPTALTAALLDHFHMASVEQVLHGLTARDSAAEFESRFIHPKQGGLARVLLDVADQGDLIARRIVQAHGEALGEHALVAARKVGLLNQVYTLVLTGGVLRHRAPLLGEAIVARVCSRSPQAQIERGALEPALGAVMLALEALHVPVDVDVRARLQATQPCADLFDT